MALTHDLSASSPFSRTNASPMAGGICRRFGGNNLRGLRQRPNSGRLYEPVVATVRPVDRRVEKGGTSMGSQLEHPQTAFRFLASASVVENSPPTGSRPEPPRGDQGGRMTAFADLG